MELKKHIDYWFISAGRDWGTAQDLFSLKRYDMCLFFSHLAIEKLLKGLTLINTKAPPPYTHDLAKLADRAGVKLDNDTIQTFRLITTFNVSGRYDTEKFNFYKLCTRSFTKKHLAVCRDTYLWLKEQYPKR